MGEDIVMPPVEEGTKIPDWLTEERLNQCVNDPELQKKWEPKSGDWFFCRDLYLVLQITDLEGYYSEGDIRTILKSDHGKNSRGHWEYDVFISSPVPE